MLQCGNMLVQLMYGSGAEATKPLAAALVGCYLPSRSVKGRNQCMRGLTEILWGLSALGFRNKARHKRLQNARYHDCSVGKFVF